MLRFVEREAGCRVTKTRDLLSLLACSGSTRAVPVLSCPATWRNAILSFRDSIPARPEAHLPTRSTRSSRGARSLDIPDAAHGKAVGAAVPIERVHAA